MIYPFRHLKHGNMGYTMVVSTCKTAFKGKLPACVVMIVTLAKRGNDPKQVGPSRMLKENWLIRFNFWM